MALIIGGPDGLDPALKATAHETMRLSSLTLPHALVRRDARRSPLPGLERAQEPPPTTGVTGGTKADTGRPPGGPILRLVGNRFLHKAQGSRPFILHALPPMIYLASNSPAGANCCADPRSLRKPCCSAAPAATTTTSPRTCCPARMPSPTPNGRQRQGGGIQRMRWRELAPAPAAGRRHHPRTRRRDHRQTRRRRARGGDPAAPVRTRPSGAHRGGGERWPALRDSACRPATVRFAPVLKTRSATTWPPAKPTTRPAPTASRARRAVHRGDPRQLQRHHGSAALRDRRPAEGIRLFSNRPPAGIRRNEENNSRTRGRPRRPSDTPDERTIGDREAPAQPGPHPSPSFARHHVRRIPHQFHPQETRVALMQQGVVQEVHVERTASRGIVGNIYLGGGACCPACSRPSWTWAWSAPPSSTWPTSGPTATPATPRGPSSASSPRPEPHGAGALKDPIGTKGARLSTRSPSPADAGLSAPGQAHRHSQRIGDEAGREALRERVSRLLPADEKGGYIVRTMAEYATDDELAADIAYLASCGPRSQPHRRRLPAHRAVPGPQPAQRVLRDFVTDATTRIVADSRENFQKLMAFQRIHAPGRPAARTLHRRASAVRPARRRGRDREGPGPPRRPQVRRLPDHRPDRGDDHRRREHRRLRRRPQLRRHHLQDQPRGRPGHRPPAAPAQPGAASSSSTSSTWKAPNTGPRCSTSSARALSRDHTKMTVNGFTPLGLVEMTASAPANPSPTCCANLPHLQWGGAGEDRPHRRLRNPPRTAARSPPVQREGIRVLAAPIVIDLFLEEESQSLAMLSDFIGKTISCTWRPATGRSNSTSCCFEANPTMLME